MAPSTILARWKVGNSQSSVPIIARTITTQLGGHATGRRVVQVRPFRLPGSQSGTGKTTGATRTDRDLNEKKKDDGRNLFVVRIVTHGNAEQVKVFVEDPVAPKREQEAPGMGLGMAEGSMMDFEPASLPPTPPHTRWTYCALAGGAPGGPQSTPFDAFLQRVLLGGGPSANSPNVGAWIARSTAITVDGFVFACGGVGGTLGDWEIKVGAVAVKGGAAAGTSRGVLVEVRLCRSLEGAGTDVRSAQATYLAVPYLPAGSTYLQDFVSTLFPPQAVAAGEIEWIVVPDEDFYEAGLVDRPKLSQGEEEGEWEWTEKHSAFAYLQMLKNEGLL